MAIYIRSNPAIHGLCPPDSDSSVKFSQFADDTTLLLVDDQSITQAFRTFNLYERASGAKIIKKKYKGLWSGAFRDRTDQIHGFDWYNDYIPVKTLGQYFTNVSCDELNWSPRIRRINEIIAVWRHLSLALMAEHR